MQNTDNVTTPSEMDSVVRLLRLAQNPVTPAPGTDKGAKGEMRRQNGEPLLDQNQAATLRNLEEVRFPFGIHQGLALAAILKHDPKYLHGVEAEVKASSDLKNKVREFLSLKGR